MDQREDRSHGESAIRADCEEARIVSKRGSRGSERAYITSENGKVLATQGGRAEQAGRARSVKDSTGVKEGVFGCEKSSVAKRHAQKLRFTSYSPTSFVSGGDRKARTDTPARPPLRADFAAGWKSQTLAAWG